MAEENQTVDQEFMANDYFAEFEPVDDDPNDAPAQPDTPDNSKEQPNTPQGGKDQDKASLDATPDEFQIPQGFGKQWYSKGDDGNVTFNTDEALSFFTPKDGYDGFKVPEIKYADPAPPSAEPPKSKYEQFIEDQQKEQDSIRENMFMWPTLYNQAIDQGYSTQEAAEYANRKTNDIIGKEIRNAGIRREADRDRIADERIEEMKKNHETEQRSATNENYFYNYFGGGQKGADIYNQVMVTAYPYLQHMCEIANPGCFNNKTKDEVNAVIKNYYNKVASDMNSLSMLVELGMNKIFRGHAKNMIERGVRNSGGRMVPIGGPSGLNPAPAQPTSQEKSSLDTYLEQV